MSLDLLVKLSQIITPIVLALAGYFISRSLNLQASNTRLISNFNLKWVDVLIDKCVKYSNLVTDIMVRLHELAYDPQPSTGEQKKVNELVGKLKHAKYDIQIHINLVDHTSELGATINQIFNDLSKIFKGLS
ncbi:MAG: hypothetical protein COA91_01595 [Robiginitomaculum sp.]|nr:MAG: hypothetical protein COA91_01595 [Robiginitomaculum sp.]